jgi:hypothetical protein
VALIVVPYSGQRKGVHGRDTRNLTPTPPQFLAVDLGAAAGRCATWSVPLHCELGETRSFFDLVVLRGMFRALRFGFGGLCGHGLVAASGIAPWIGGGALLSGHRRVEDDPWAKDLVINGRDQIWPAGLGRRARNHRILTGRLGLDRKIPLRRGFRDRCIVDAWPGLDQTP